MKRFVLALFALCGITVFSHACTGISFMSKDSSFVMARTIEFADMDLPSEYVIIPRGQKLQSFTPKGADGMKFESKYGVVGLSVIRKEFIAEGMNEMGLSTGLFFFPRYGSYAPFKESHKSTTVADLQLNQWMLSQFATVDEVIEAIPHIHIVGLEQTAVVHWRIGDSSGRQVVLEIVDGKAKFYENGVGVITNAPGFDWQLTNLNNYVNLYSGSAKEQTLRSVTLLPTGAHSGFLGLPGDFTPPSRFVRAAFFCAYAPQQPNGFETVKQCFHILNNFDVPSSIDSTDKNVNIPSATQWTSAIDLTNRKVYYKTSYNNSIRCIDLSLIDFASIDYQSFPLDIERVQPVELIVVE